MKKPFKIVFAGFTIVLYCLAINFHSGGLISGIDGFSENETASSRVYFAGEIPFVANFAIQESANFLFLFNTTSDAYKQIQLFKAANHVREIQLFSSADQYISHFLNFPIRIRKADLIFPFHYFFDTTRF